MLTLRSLETFAQEQERLILKLDFVSENVAVGVLKYIFFVSGSQEQIVGIGQFGDNCERKREFDFQARRFGKCRR